MRALASPAQLRGQLIRWMLVTVPGVLLLGFLSASGSSPNTAWFAGLAKPAFYPPAAAFPLVWSALYGAMGAALALVLVARRARGRVVAVAAFAAQLALNLAWSPLFFGAHRLHAAFVDIILLDLAVAITLVLFWRVRRLAGGLMLPYLAWVLFASVLMWQILLLNPGADGRAGGGAVTRIEIGT